MTIKQSTILASRISQPLISMKQERKKLPTNASQCGNFTLVLGIMEEIPFREPFSRHCELLVRTKSQVERFLKLKFMRRSIIFCLFYFFSSNSYGQEMGYYWSKLVESIEGSSSYEQRSIHEGSPLSLWLEIDSSTVNNDSVRVRVHFIEALKGCGSNYTLGTLVLHSRSASNDSRRDIYIYDKFVSTVSDFPSTSSWMMVARDGAVIIIELQDCGISREFGLFLLER